MTSIFIQRGSSPATAASAKPLQVAVLQSVMRLVESIRTWRRINRDIDILMALDDRMLADIGLTRDDIDHLARHGTLPKRHCKVYLVERPRSGRADTAEEAIALSPSPPLLLEDRGRPGEEEYAWILGFFFLPIALWAVFSLAWGMNRREPPPHPRFWA